MNNSDFKLLILASLVLVSCLMIFFVFSLENSTSNEQCALIHSPKQSHADYVNCVRILSNGGTIHESLEEVQ